MENIVKVGRCGRITIPNRIRQQYGIIESNQLIVEATENGILFKPIPTV
jgi:AbrB family looped-hinge helix DNA binding protein